MSIDQKRDPQWTPLEQLEERCMLSGDGAAVEGKVYRAAASATVVKEAAPAPAEPQPTLSIDYKKSPIPGDILEDLEDINDSEVGGNLIEKLQERHPRFFGLIDLGDEGDDEDEGDIIIELPE